jgi:hypothetical protein
LLAGEAGLFTVQDAASPPIDLFSPRLLHLAVERQEFGFELGELLIAELAKFRNHALNPLRTCHAHQRRCPCCARQGAELEACSRCGRRVS